MSLVKKLIKETGADETAARYLLEACGNDYAMAVTMYADSTPSQSAAAGASGSSTAVDEAVALAAAVSWADEEDEEEEVRAPIAPKFEVMCPPEDLAAMGGARHIQHFRDFEQETRHQERMMGLAPGGGVFARTQTASGTDSEAAAKQRETADKQQHRKKLEDLFKPPLDLIFAGSFFGAREAGKMRGQWLLVNIQDMKDFCCHMINRDIWSNGSVRKLLADTFLLWQASHDSEHGKKYMNFYPNVRFPYIAIIDSRTGLHMATFTNSDPKAFCLFLKDFVKINGKMLNNEQYEEQFQGNISAGAGSNSSSAGTGSNSSSAGAGSPTSSSAPSVSSSSSNSVHGSSNTKRKRAATSTAETLNTRPSPLKKLRRGSSGEATPAATASTGPSQAVHDITEEDQMKLAIAESLKALECTTIDDDSDEGSIIGDLETFSEPEEEEEDEDEVNYSFESREVAASVDDGVGDKEEEVAVAASNSSGAGTSEWLTAKGTLTNGNCLGFSGSCSSTTSNLAPKLLLAKALDTSSSSTTDDSTAAESSNTSISDTDGGWEALCGPYRGGPCSSLILRLPDGKRETVDLPSAAPLKVIQEYLCRQGYLPPRYRALAGWPKKDLFSFDQTTSLKNAGLLSRDTIILQED